MLVRALLLVTSVALWSCDHKPDEPVKSATTSIEQPPAAPAKPPDAIVKACYRARLLMDSEAA